MNTRKTIGIILMVLLLILCAVLMVLRFSAAKASDAAALRESMATPVPTATPDVTPGAERYAGTHGDAGADRYARANAGPGLPCRPRRGARSARAAGYRYQQLGVYPRKRR